MNPLGLFVQQLVGAVAEAEKPRRTEHPAKYGFCVRCEKDNQKLRFNRIGAKGEPIFNNYCEQCHRAYMKAYKRKHFVGRTRVSRP